MPSASATRMTCGAGSAGRAARGSPDEQMTLMTDLTFERVVIVHRLIGDLRRILCGFAKKWWRRSVGSNHQVISSISLPNKHHDIREATPSMTRIQHLLRDKRHKATSNLNFRRKASMVTLNESKQAANN